MAGHGRLLAAQKLGVHLVPVDYQDFASDDEELAVLLSDNRLAELAETDKDSMKELLKELDGKIDLDLTGFDVDSLDDLLDRLNTTESDSNTVTPPPARPIKKLGDLYELGNHRLLCGDSTNADDVRRVMNGERAILFAVLSGYFFQ